MASFTISTLCLLLAAVTVFAQDETNATTTGTTTTTTTTTTTAAPTTPALPSYTVSTLVHPPFLMRDGAMFRGFIPELLEKLGEEMDVTFKLQLAKDGRYGASDNNTWNGIIGELIRGEADIAGAALTVTGRREEVVDFTVPFMSSGVEPLIGARPTPAPAVIFLVFQPFTVGSWFLLIFAFLAFCACMYGIHRFNPYEARQVFGREGKCSEEDAKAFEPLNTLWFGYTTLMWQGYSSIPRSLAGKILIAFWFFFGVCVLVLYTVAMVAIYPSATAPTPVPQFTSLQQLVSAEQEFAVINGGSTEQFFSSSNVALYKEMYTNMGVVDSMEDGIAGSENGEFVFLAEDNMVAYHIQKDPCSLKAVGGLLNSIAYALATKKASPLRDSINEALSDLMTDGDVSLLVNKWWPKPSMCTENLSATPPPPGQSVTAATMAGPIILLLLGMLLAGFVTALQYFLYNRNQMEKKETLVDAEEGLNETTQTLLNKDAKTDPATEGTEMEVKEKDEKPANGDAERELEPEDKEEKVEEIKADEEKKE